MVVNAVHPAKAPSSIAVTPSGIQMVVNDAQF